MSGSASPRSSVLGRAARQGVVVLLLLLVFGWAARSAAQDSGSVQVVVHADNPVTSLTKREVSDLFLKKRARWPGGGPVVAIDLQVDSTVRERFSRAILGRPAVNVEAYWNQRLFAGLETPPRVVTSDEQVLRAVRSNVHAIGYVSEGARLVGVKALTITP